MNRLSHRLGCCKSENDFLRIFRTNSFGFTSLFLHESYTESFHFPLLDVGHADCFKGFLDILWTQFAHDRWHQQGINKALTPSAGIAAPLISIFHFPLSDSITSDVTKILSCSPSF